MRSRERDLIHRIARLQGARLHGFLDGSADGVAGFQ